MECEEFGQLEGNGHPLHEPGLRMQIKATDEERARLGDKIAWHEKFQKKQTADNRKNKRIVPNNPLSSLILADGSSQRCFVIDMSITVVAVSAESCPSSGSRLRSARSWVASCATWPAALRSSSSKSGASPLPERMLIQPTP